MREAASFIAAHSAAAPRSLLHSLADGLEHAFRAVIHRRSVVRLADLDDHLLDDLGISRDEVRQALEQPFGIDPSAELQRIVLRNRSRGWRA